MTVTMRIGGIEKAVDDVKPVAIIFPIIFSAVRGARRWLVIGAGATAWEGRKRFTS